MNKQYMINVFKAIQYLEQGFLFTKFDLLKGNLFKAFFLLDNHKHAYVKAILRYVIYSDKMSLARFYVPKLIKDLKVEVYGQQTNR